jgi:hypothetical protein
MDAETVLGVGVGVGVGVGSLGGDGETAIHQSPGEVAPAPVEEATRAKPQKQNDAAKPQKQSSKAAKPAAAAYFPLPSKHLLWVPREHQP